MMRSSVSFARTPLEEIGQKVEEIKALGWREREDGRGDPWGASFVKDFDDYVPGQAEQELAAVMGDYWVDVEEIKALLERAGAAGKS